MIGRIPLLLVLSLLPSLAATVGCFGQTDSGAAVEAKPGRFTGRIAYADGSPIALPGVTYKVTINGITAAGERNSFDAPVSADGTFSAKLPKGQFYPPFGTVTFPFEGKNFTVSLDPVDPVQAPRESAPGIVQDFVWKLTGPRPAALNPDVNNAEHWFGVTIPLSFQPYRDDTKQSVRQLPDGAKLVWTLKPLSKLVNGSDAKPVTLEREWRELRTPAVSPLNDLPPARYEVSAVATLSDGSTKRLLLRSGDDLGPYKPSVEVGLEPHANLGHIRAPMIRWTVEE